MEESVLSFQSVSVSTLPSQKKSSKIECVTQSEGEGEEEEKGEAEEVEGEVLVEDSYSWEL